MDRRRQKEHAGKLLSLLFTTFLAFILSFSKLTNNLIQKALYTFSRNKSTGDNGGGSGWSQDGMLKFHELYKAVKRDRRKQSPAFNQQELLKMFHKRRQLEAGRGGRPQEVNRVGNGHSSASTSSMTVVATKTQMKKRTGTTTIRKIGRAHV